MISIQALQFFPLLNHLSTEHLNQISKICNKVSLDADDWLLEEGGDAANLYLLTEGSISLTLSLPLEEGGEHLQRSSPLKPGDLIGWSAVIGHDTYKFGAIANEASTLIRIDDSQLRQFIVDYPESGSVYLPCDDSGTR